MFNSNSKHLIKEFWKKTTCRLLTNPNQLVNKYKIAALDIGTSKIGMAVSDDLQISAIPYKIFYNDFFSPSSLNEFNDKIKTENITGFVIGYPLLSQNNHPDSYHYEFLYNLRKNTKIENILLWDESFSTQISKIIYPHYLSLEPSCYGGKLERKFGKKPRFSPKSTYELPIDDKAAAVILDEYLYYINNNYEQFREDKKIF